MPLKQHEFYVYYSAGNVYARVGDAAPVLAEAFETPQEAHDRVQSIVNPHGYRPEKFGQLGYLAPEYQDAISGNCEEYVRSAYAAAGTPLES